MALAFQILIVKKKSKFLTSVNSRLQKPVILAGCPLLPRFLVHSRISLGEMRCARLLP